jgi:hypothetical protein
MLLTPPTPLHDFDSLIFSDDALHLEQEIIPRALAKWAIQKKDFNTSTAPFIEKQDLVGVIARQSVR